MKTFFKKILLYLTLFLIIDIIFSNFFFNQEIKFSCVINSNKDGFYDLKKNCKVREKYIKNVKSYNVFTDENGQRFSGKKKDSRNKKNILLFGDSFTYGLGLDYSKTYVGILENKIKEYNFLNFGVIGYSPSVYYYQIKNFLKSENTFSKIILTIDISDFQEEANGWEYNKNWDYPKRILKDTNQKDILKQRKEKKDDFKDKNFKGSRFIASLINNFFRNIRHDYILEKKNKKIKPDETYMGSFLYKNTNLSFWEPLGFENSKKKIQELIIEISQISLDNNSDFYLLIYPWPDTLEYGQEFFNLEEYVNNLCLESNCKAVINTFDEFKKYKKQNKNWLNDLYINGDLHLTKKGNEIISKKIIEEAFNENY